MAAPGRVARLLGTDSPFIFELHMPGVVGPVAEYPADMVGATTITLGRENGLSAASPGSINTAVVGDLVASAPVLQIGRPCRLRLSDAALEYIYGSTVSADATASRYRFTGLTTDLGDVRVTKRTGPQVIPVTGVTPMSFIGPVLVPVFGSDGDSDVDLILQTLQSAVNSLLIFAEGIPDGDAWWDKIAARPGVQTFDAIPFSDSDSAEGQIRKIGASVSGVLLEQRDGHPDWLTPENRRDYPNVIGEIQAGEMYANLMVRQDFTNVIDIAYVSFRIGDDTGQAGAFDNDAIYDHGDCTLVLDSWLSDNDDAAAIAADIVARYAWPAWRLSAVTVDLTEIGEASLPRLGQFLRAEIGDLVAVLGLPATSPVAGGYYWIEGTTERITPARWTMTFNLVPYGLLAAATRWGDVPDGITWGDVAPDLTWRRATTWQADPLPWGSWRAHGFDTYADLTDPWSAN